LKHIHTLYPKYIKRFLDIILSLSALIVLSPIFILLILLGAIFMRGNPFFVQKRPGKNERIFSLIKFRTMADLYDSTGVPLPDSQRLNRYGKFLRSTSLDELPELINILCGTLSIVGPRPLLVEYLPLYTQEQHHRHDVSPGLTGWAQVHGRNLCTWEEKFNYDLWYVENIRFSVDVKIILMTILSVLKQEGITADGSATTHAFSGSKSGGQHK